jgi:hypothetical protein
LLDHLEREIHALQINGQGGSRFQFQFMDPRILSLLLGFQVQGNLAIAFQRHDKIALKVEFDEAHVVCRSVPDIINHVAEGYLIGNGLPQQLLIDFNFRHRRPTLVLTRFSVHIDFRFADQVIVHR